MNRATPENFGHVLDSNNSSAGHFDADDLHSTTQAELLATCPPTSQICEPICNKPTIDSKTTTATNRHVKRFEDFSSHCPRTLSPRIQDRSINVTLRCCGMGSSELRDGRRRRMRRTRRAQNKNECGAERTVDRHVGATRQRKQALRHLWSALRRETRNLLERSILHGMLNAQGDQQIRECALSF